MPQPKTHALTLLALLSLLTTTTAICYFPNGQSDDDPVNNQCFSITNEYSGCCALNRTNPSGGSLSDGRTNDLCLDNGLCKNIATNTTEDGTETTIVEYWRGMCTSPEWPERSCLDFCNTGRGAGKTMQVTPCDGTENSTEWCCGSSTYCCGTSDAITIAAVLPVLASASASDSASASPSPTPSETTTQTQEQTQTPTPTPTTTTSNSLSTGAKAGIGVGVSAGAIIIIGILVFLWMRRRRQTGKEQLHSATPSPPALVAEKDPIIPKGQNQSPGGDQQERYVEMDGANGTANANGIGNGTAYELNGDDEMRHELPAPVGR